MAHIRCMCYVEAFAQSIHVNVQTHIPSIHGNMVWAKKMLMSISASILYHFLLVITSISSPHFLLIDCNLSILLLLMCIILYQWWLFCMTSSSLLVLSLSLHFFVFHYCCFEQPHLFVHYCMLYVMV